MIAPAASYVGEGELARIVKICHNVFLGVVTQSLAEITVLAQKAGVPRHAFLDFMSSVGPLRFAVFNLIGAAIWALAVSGLGYLFGHAIEWFLADLAALEKWGLLGVVAVVVVLMARRRARRRAGP